MSLDAILRLHLPFALKRTKKLLRNSLAGYALALGMGCGSVASSPADAGSSYDPGMNRADASLADRPANYRTDGNYDLGNEVDAPPNGVIPDAGIDGRIIDGSFSSDGPAQDGFYPDGGVRDASISFADAASPDGGIEEVIEGIYVTPETNDVVREVIDDVEVFYSPDKVLVEVSPSTSRAEVRSLAEEIGGEISGYIDPIHWYELRVPDAAEALSALEGNPLVVTAGLNYAMTLDALDIESWPERSQVWGFDKIMLPQAYELIGDRELETVKVAVLDSGFDLEHPELASRFLEGHDFGSSDTDPTYRDFPRGSGEWLHGTMVAGIIAMENNGEILNGVAPHAEILPLKISPSRAGDEDETYYSKIFRGAAGIMYATMQGADVINMSIGGNAPRRLLPPMLSTAVRYADSRDVVLVASAGNDGFYSDTHFPSAFQEVISVGATTPTDPEQRWLGSNYAWRDAPDYLLLAAPGENIWSSVPIGSFPFRTEYPFLAGASGTSFSAPFVSGLAALVKSIDPSLTSSEIKQILLDSADPIPITGRDGEAHTWKRINAYRAAALALGYVPSGEVCDGLDNNFDGAVDNGLELRLRGCVAGSGECRRSGWEEQVCEGITGWSDYRDCDAVPGAPLPERCDAHDWDCDGEKYNGFNIGELCSVGAGECFAEGLYECTPDGSAVRCDARGGRAEDEICDGLDNDCDGIVDNNLVPSSQVCSAGVGECQRSGLEERVCEGAAGWGDFRDCDAVAGVLGEEICDELDDDCDGVVDNECVGGEPRVIQVAGGDVHTCALLADSTVRCWGSNSYGQLGDGTTIDRYTPTSVYELDNVAQIALGNLHTCARLADSTVWCWGDNVYGQLGDGSETHHYTPTLVPELTNVTQIAVGGIHTCAMLDDGAVQCWGRIGEYLPTPTPISGLDNVSQIRAGGGHTCAVLDDSTCQCFGNNVYGQSGQHPRTVFLASPTTVPGIVNVAQLALGGAHTCTLFDDGTAQCWGYNYRGQLGNGMTTSSYSPTAVSGLSNAIQLALGRDHTCALLVDSTVRCWGRNFAGQLGDGTTTDRYTPTPVPGLNNVIQIALGSNNTCALLADGAVWCWGYNLNGQLGDGTTTDRYTPTEVVW